jgi:hypothetical protein
MGDLVRLENSFHWRPVLEYALMYQKTYGIKCRVKRDKYGVWRCWPLRSSKADISDCKPTGVLI